ncbi:hypothetical protein GCM10027444_19930 [Actinopolyspora lacussalsi]
MVSSNASRDSIVPAGVFVGGSPGFVAEAPASGKLQRVAISTDSVDSNTLVQTKPDNRASTASRINAGNGRRRRYRGPRSPFPVLAVDTFCHPPLIEPSFVPVS